MQSFSKFDKEIKKSISQKVNDITPSEDMFSKIQTSIADRKEDYTMYTKSKKHTKSIMIACAILVFTSATCFAASKIASISGGTDKRFETFPSQTQIEKAVGFTPKYLEDFTNGYEFEEGYTGTVKGSDNEQNTIAEMKTVGFTYIKEDSEINLDAMQMPQNGTYPDMKGEKIVLSNGQTVFYSDWMHKFEPADYVMTEQDKIDEANGTYQFSFGTDSEIISHCQFIEWEENNIRYSLYYDNDSLTKDDMIKMSEEVLNVNVK